MVKKKVNNKSRNKKNIIKTKDEREEKVEQKNKFEIENKARFGLGVALVVPEILILIGFGLSLLNESLITIILVAIAAFLYNAIAFILIWTGSRTKKKQ